MGSPVAKRGPGGQSKSKVFKHVCFLFLLPLFCFAFVLFFILKYVPFFCFAFVLFSFDFEICAI